MEGTLGCQLKKPPSSFKLTWFDRLAVVIQDICSKLADHGKKACSLSYVFSLSLSLSLFFFFFFFFTPEGLSDVLGSSSDT